MNAPDGSRIDLWARNRPSVHNEWLVIASAGRLTPHTQKWHGMAWSKSLPQAVRLAVQNLRDRGPWGRAT